MTTKITTPAPVVTDSRDVLAAKLITELGELENGHLLQKVLLAVRLTRKGRPVKDSPSADKFSPDDLERRAHSLKMYLGRATISRYQLIWEKALAEKKVSIAVNDISMNAKPEDIVGELTDDLVREYYAAVVGSTKLTKKAEPGTSVPGAAVADAATNRENKGIDDKDTTENLILEKKNLQIAVEKYTARISQIEAVVRQREAADKK